MRFKIVRSSVTGGDAALGVSTPVEEVEVPTRQVAAGIFSAGTISALLTTLLTTALPALLNRPAAEFTRQLERDRFRVELLQRALQLPDSTDRANTLRLFLATKLLADDSGRLVRLLEDSSQRMSRVPHWEAVPTGKPGSTPVGAKSKDTAVTKPQPAAGAGK